MGVVQRKRRSQLFTPLDQKRPNKNLTDERPEVENPQAAEDVSEKLGGLWELALEEDIDMSKRAKKHDATAKSKEVEASNETITSIAVTQPTKNKIGNRKAKLTAKHGKKAKLEKAIPSQPSKISLESATVIQEEESDEIENDIEEEEEEEDIYDDNEVGADKKKQDVKNAKTERPDSKDNKEAAILPFDITTTQARSRFRPVPLYIHSLFTKKLEPHYIYIKKCEATECPLKLSPETTLTILNLPLGCKSTHVTKLLSSNKLAGKDAVEKVFFVDKSSLLSRSDQLQLPHNVTKKMIEDIEQGKNYTTDLIKILTGQLNSGFTAGDHPLSVRRYTSVAYVVMKKVSQLNKVLKYSQSSENNKLVLDLPQVDGMERWLGNYKLRHPDPDAFQNYLDNYMGAYQNKVAQDKYKESLTMDIEDEDGFVKVVQGKVTNLASDGTTVKAISRPSQRELSKRVALEDLVPKSTILPKLYKSENRESAQSRLVRLRHEFEQDKLRIAELKRRRQFQPL